MLGRLDDALRGRAGELCFVFHRAFTRFFFFLLGNFHLHPRPKENMSSFSSVPAANVTIAPNLAFETGVYTHFLH